MIARLVILIFLIMSFREIKEMNREVKHIKHACTQKKIEERLERISGIMEKHIKIHPIHNSV